MSSPDVTTSPHRTPQTRLGDDRGQSLVEFALASTVFLMTIFATLEFGIAVSRYNMVADLAQEGARWAAVRGLHGITQANEGAISDYVNSRASGMSVVVTTPLTGSAGASALTAGQTILVKVVTSYAPLSGFIPQTTLNIQSRAIMTISR